MHYLYNIIMIEEVYNTCAGCPRGPEKLIYWRRFPFLTATGSRSSHPQPRAHISASSPKSNVYAHPPRTRLCGLSATVLVVYKRFLSSSGRFTCTIAALKWYKSFQLIYTCFRHRYSLLIFPDLFFLTAPTCRFPLETVGNVTDYPSSVFHYSTQQCPQQSMHNIIILSYRTQAAGCPQQPMHNINTQPWKNCRNEVSQTNFRLNISIYVHYFSIPLRNCILILLIFLTLWLDEILQKFCLFGLLDKQI